MNYFQPPHPNGEENKQNNLPGKMLNNYFQPAPQHNYSNGFFAGGPEGETGGPGAIIRNSSLLIIYRTNINMNSKTFHPRSELATSPWLSRWRRE